MPVLNWLNRDEHLNIAERVPYRLLEEVPELGCGDPDTGNLLVQGDNLDALKALLPFYAGQVKCVYIDPPYNTKSAFTHYDDNLEHSTWLGTLWARLKLLREFLSKDGSFWISIDDDEAAYMRVIMDEIMGRSRFIAQNVWQKRYSRENREAIGDVHEYIMVYATNPSVFKEIRNKVPLTKEQAKIYKNPNSDPNGRWRGIPMTAQEGHATPEQFYEIIGPNGKVHKPSEGRCWGLSKKTFERLRSEGKIWFGKDGSSQPNVIRYLSEVDGFAPWTWWPNEEVGHTDEAKKEIHALFGKTDAFDTPKPERLLHRIIHIATNPGDLVMDSFLGSGTTAAVAHKMGRRYIGIEMGEHARTHCAARLRKVVEGEQGGISEAVKWQGGGGFRFFRLGGEVFETDGRLKAGLTFGQLAAHIWFSETYTPWRLNRETRELHEKGKREKSTFLGVHDGTAYALLYNGVLGDRAPAGGNVLTSKTLKLIQEDAGDAKYDKLVVYGECALGAAWKHARIEFRQIPYDVKAR